MHKMTESLKSRFTEYDSWKVKLFFERVFLGHIWLFFRAFTRQIEAPCSSEVRCSSLISPNGWLWNWPAPWAPDLHIGLSATEWFSFDVGSWRNSWCFMAWTFRRSHPWRRTFAWLFENMLPDEVGEDLKFRFRKCSLKWRSKKQ